MKIPVLIFILIFLVTVNVEALSINEFMPDPADNCWDCSEWIEITSGENVSLENITLDTGETSPLTLNGTISSGEFMIITKNLSAFLEIWDTEAIVIENRGMSLRNKNGDNITLYNNSVMLQRIEYGTPQNNTSYGICDGIIVPQNISTPGLPNVCARGETNQTTNETNQTNHTSGASNMCDLLLTISSDSIFNSGGKHSYYLELEDHGCDQQEKQVKIEYWIEDLFGNIAKSKYTTTKNMTCSKNISRQWTPGDTDGSEAYYIMANITDPGCNDTNHMNNYAEKLIVVKGTGPYSEPECLCETPECNCPLCSCSPYLPGGSEEETEEKEFGIISTPEYAAAGQEVNMSFMIRNPEDSVRECVVYSYIYDGNRLVSLGFYGNKWTKEWKANEKNVTVPPNSSSEFSLSNMIPEETVPGEYSLRVRILCEGKKHDLTEKIIIEKTIPPPPGHVSEETGEAEQNNTEYNELDEPEETGPAIRLPTGEITSRTSDNWVSDLFENVINFFKNLFNL